MTRAFIAVTVALTMMLAPKTATSAAAMEKPHQCAALSAAVKPQLAGSNASFVRSYQPGQGEGQLPAGLATSAFVYDNALAVIALTACGDTAQASVIGNAISLALRGDRTFKDGRIRNAYRSGPVDKAAALLPGWWDGTQNIWAEDPAQNGTSTGNAAWAALALLTLHQATAHGRFLADAQRLIDWVIAGTSSGRTLSGQTLSSQGFRGGVHGFDPQQISLQWISTEHNVDVYAAAAWLFRLTDDRTYAEAASQARAFLEKAFDTDHFLLGTTPDGRLADRGMLALDVQLWPWMAVQDAPTQWRSALGFAAAHMAVDDGFDFNGDRDGVWVEGTAQASLAYRIAGDAARSAQLLRATEADRTPSGFLNATRSARLSTGLSIDPTKTQADFFYFRRPHLGATAWATLAATGWNPFTGRELD